MAGKRTAPLGRRLFWLSSQSGGAGIRQGEKRQSPLASGGAAAVWGSCASPDCAVHGSNRRAQAIHGLLAPDPRTTASFAIWMSVASSMPASACLAEAGSITAAKDVATWGCCPSGTWMYRARVLEQDAEPRGGQHPHVAAAPPEGEVFALVLQRRPPPEAKLLPLQQRPRTETGAFRGTPSESSHHDLEAAPSPFAISRARARPVHPARAASFPGPGR